MLFEMIRDSIQKGIDFNFPKEEKEKEEENEHSSKS